MKSKKILAGFLSVSILSLSSIAAFAANPTDLKAINEEGQVKEIMPQASFKSFTGTVREIKELKGVQGSKIVSVENESGQPANIIISDDTYILNNAEITVGSVITGFYDANAPMIMIFPPQYKAEVVAIENKEQNIKVDVFDKDLVSADNSLKLNISQETEIITKDGKAFTGQLENQKLVVIYGPSTRSIPAQTSPNKIVVLLESKDTGTSVGDDSALEIVVNNGKIEAPSAYTTEQGTVMVPLRAIAEALGFDVKWEGESKSIMLGKDISLTLDQDNYLNSNASNAAPIKLGTAPSLMKGTTFVPLSFFREVAHMNNAYVHEGQIVIDNGEITPYDTVNNFDGVTMTVKEGTASSTG